jgi:hypothetical protein
MITRTQIRLLFWFERYCFARRAISYENTLYGHARPYTMAFLNRCRARVLDLIMQDHIDRVTPKGNESWEML